MTTALLLAFLAPAMAETKAAWVGTDTLNVRKSPGESAAKLGELSRGQRIKVVAFRDDRWCKIITPTGRTGYVKEEYLDWRAPSGGSSSGSASSSSAKPAWINAPVANMRKTASVSAGVAGQLLQGMKVYVVASSGSWRKVKASNGKYGWVRSDLLVFDADQGRKLAGTPNPAAAQTSKPAWIDAGTANVRSGPSQSATKIGEYPRGAKVYVVAREGDWVKVRNPNGAGWVNRELLEYDTERGRRLAAAASPTSSRTASSSGDKAYCVGTQVNLRSGPGTCYGASKELSRGTAVFIKGEKGSWCKVSTTGGSSGWIAGWYLRRHGARKTVAANPTGASITFARHEVSRPRTTSSEPRFKPFRAWIAEDNTNVRYGAGVEKDVKFQLDKRTAVTVIDTYGQWCKIKTESGSTGWAAGWVLDFQPPGEPEVTAVVGGEKQEVKTGTVSKPQVNVRAGASADADIVATANEGTSVVITDRQGDWYKVALTDGTTGWVSSDLIEPHAESGTGGTQAPDTGDGGWSRDGSSVGRSMVREAMRHIGKSYVRGAEGPSSFDCSGLTQYVHSKFGIHLARTTTGQYMQGRSVSRDNMQPGDVVVFRNTYRSGISHVGLYIGNGKFVHAANSRSGVKVSDLDDSYYGQRYAGARRMY